jgi:hypothetical protein
MRELPAPQNKNGISVSKNTSEESRGDMHLKINAILIHHTPNIAQPIREAIHNLPHEHLLLRSPPTAVPVAHVERVRAAGLSREVVEQTFDLAFFGGEV